MNLFLIKFKKIIPRYIRVFIHKIYFDYVMVFLEKTIFFKKLYFRNITLPEHANIIDPKTKALIRHNFYENYEIEAIEKMKIWDNNFLDLGSSLGLCSYIVSSNLSNRHKHILVEPNKILLEYSKLIMSKSKHDNKHFINKAIGYESRIEMFNPGIDTLSGKILPINQKKIFEIIECTNIENIVKENKLDSINILIDIEGLSFYPLFKEELIMQKCEKIIIEESFDDKFTYEKVLEQLKYLGFEIVYFKETWGSCIIGAEKYSKKV